MEDKAQIAIIEDEKEMLDVLSGVFEGEHEVFCYSHPIDFLMEESSVDFDLILTDLKMPTVNGDHIIEILKLSNAHNKVIAITGLSMDSELIAKVKEISDGPILEKPLDLAKLQAEVKKILGR